ncbi:MAG: hypothetical protein K9M19_01785 [Candidatus Marinimicrobia bacterium]|nr:hypothetical protein [Candidatus Neomarinimicrobiota bacterium]
MQQEQAVQVLNSQGRQEATIAATAEDVVIVSPSRRYFAIVALLPDQTASAAGRLLSVRVFHHTGTSLYHSASPFNSVFNRPQILLTDDGSLVFTDQYETTIREIYDGTTLNEIELSRFFPNWETENDTWLNAVTPDRGYYVVSSIMDSMTQQPVVQVAILSNRLNLLSHYQIPGQVLRLFPVTGQGKAYLGFNKNELTQLALLGRDSVITLSATVPQEILPAGDPGRALFISLKGLQILNWNDGMLETGYIPQEMDKVISAAFLPGVEGYLILYGRQRLRDDEMYYDNLRLNLVNKVGDLWYAQQLDGQMRYAPGITIIDEQTVALKTDYQIKIYHVPIQLNK